MTGLPELVAFIAASPQDDLLSKLATASEIASLPIVSAIAAMVYDTWRKSRATYFKMFGDPNVKKDDGLLGVVERLDADVENLSRFTEVPRVSKVIA